jgi:hypothetical protein
MGGACGDLIAALIDNTGVEIYNGAVLHPEDRRLLKKPHTFATDEDKDSYIESISQKYRSIPSHDLEYHIKRRHNFIAVIVSDKDVAKWAATRFKRLHSDAVWNRMSQMCGATSVNDYAQMLIDNGNLVKNYNSRIINLENILNGDAIKSLNDIGIKNCSENIYKNWLDLQKGVFH